MKTTRPLTALAIVAALAAATGTGFAQQTGAKQSTDPSAHGQAAADDYKTSMDKMHEQMMAKKDADPDRAWALKMIEHHRGGIAMDEIVIKHGDDAEAKKMAQKSMDAQKKEIAELESWLDRHGGKTPKP